MPSSLVDVCRYTTTAGGTTDWTFSAAVTGYQSPTAAGIVNGATYSYRAESADLTQWEIGTGAYNTATGVLARTVVLFNSSATGTGAGQSGAGSKINFSTVPNVAIVALAEDIVGSIDGVAGAFTLGVGLSRSSQALSVSLSTASNILGADVVLNNTGLYFVGPSMAQGTSGTWLVTGYVTVRDTSAAAGFDVALNDGTTNYATGRGATVGSGSSTVITLTAIVTSPAGNLRMSVRDVGSTNGLIQFNATGNNKDSAIYGIRIA